MSVGKYKPRVLYKCHHVFTDDPDGVPETFDATFNPENVLSKVLGKNIFTIIFVIIAYRA